MKTLLLKVISVLVSKSNSPKIPNTKMLPNANESLFKKVIEAKVIPEISSLNFILVVISIRLY